MRLLKNSTFLAVFAGLSLLTIGCENATDTQKTTAGGAAIGAGVGALVDDDHRWRGAAIGGAVGGTGGYLIGKDKEEKKRVTSGY